MKDQTIYLDYNATTPLDERVLEAMLPYFCQRYANAGSTHLFGLTVRDAVDQAAENVGHAIGGKPGNIVFTSGATEAINMVFKGLLHENRKHIVTVATEHNAVLDTCAFLERSGYRITYLPVDADGIIDLDQLSETVTDETLLVSVMLANNETGVILPVRSVSEIARRQGALTLCDGTQAIGKIPLDVNDLHVDFLAFSAHKFYGPKGVGGLWLSGAAIKRLTPLLHGGGQQKGLRSGTLNVPGIIGMGKAISLAVSDMPQDQVRIKQLRDKLEEGLLGISGASVNGHRERRLYNTTNICFPGIQSDKLIIGLGPVSVSSGSACTAALTKPSHVLTAMGLDDAAGLSAIRFSLGRFTTGEEIETATARVQAAVDRLRNDASAA